VAVAQLAGFHESYVGRLEAAVSPWNWDSAADRLDSVVAVFLESWVVARGNCEVAAEWW